jgi:hypothetical protein
MCSVAGPGGPVNWVLSISGFHGFLATKPEEYPDATPCQVETGEGRAQEAHASAACGGGEMVEERDTGLLQLSCRSRKLRPSPALSA